MSNPINEPKAGWIGLVLGPLHYRSTFNDGIFREGHTPEEICTFAMQDQSIAQSFIIRLDHSNGNIVVDWLIDVPGIQIFSQPQIFLPLGSYSLRYVERLALGAKAEWRELPDDLRRVAREGATAGIYVQECLRQEFYYAVKSGKCEVWGRRNSRLAPFEKIPFDVFRSYWPGIIIWPPDFGDGVSAEIEGEPTLYALQVAAAASSPEDKPVPFSDAERREWMVSLAENNADKAHKIFKKHPRFDGTKQLAFRSEWKEVRDTKVGRPSKKIVK